MLGSIDIDVLEANFCNFTKHPNVYCNVLCRKEKNASKRAYIPFFLEYFKQIWTILYRDRNQFALENFKYSQLSNGPKAHSTLVSWKLVKAMKSVFGFNFFDPCQSLNLVHDTMQFDSDNCPFSWKVSIFYSKKRFNYHLIHCSDVTKGWSRYCCLSI